MRSVKYTLLFIYTIFIFYFQGCEHQALTVKDIVSQQIERPKRIFPLIVYFSNEFSNDQLDCIMTAVKDIEKDTNNIIKVNPVFNWIPDNDFSEREYKTYPFINVWIKKHDDPLLFKMQLETSLTADGFNDGNYIILVDDGNYSCYKIYMQFKHEFCHALGMGHIKNQYPALMNSGGNLGEFTKYDKILFCSIYDC